MKTSHIFPSSVLAPRPSNKNEPLYINVKTTDEGKHNLRQHSPVTTPLLCSKMSYPANINAPKKKAPNPSLQERRRARLENVPKLTLPSDDTKPEWKVLAESGQVREKYLEYDPVNVALIGDKDLLFSLRDLYNPASQPRSLIELSYLEFVVEAIEARLRSL